MSDIMLIPENRELSVVDVKNQINKIQELMRAVMKEGEHYGKIPGVEKDSLYKAGAEKICLTFRLVAAFVYIQTNFDNGHREYRVECKICTMADNKLVGQGVGVCSTMESKYRYRNDIQILEEDIPENYWNDPDSKKAWAKKGFTTKKISGIWRWCKQTGERMENPDIADQYNTVIKMAEKRAYVDATIRATAASDVFTQDIEDMNETELQGSATNKKSNPGKQNTVKGGNNSAGNIWKEINKLPADLKQNFADRIRKSPAETQAVIEEIHKILNAASAELDANAEQGFNLDGKEATGKDVT